MNWQMPEDSPVQRVQSIDALSDCEVIFTMVPDGEVVLDIASLLIKARDGNGENALLIDMSSCHPDTAKKCTRAQHDSNWMRLCRGRCQNRQN